MAQLVLNGWGVASTTPLFGWQSTSDETPVPRSSFTFIGDAKERLEAIGDGKENLTLSGGEENL